MTTNNIISTPNIQGNISSCETKVETFETARLNFWKIENTTVTTNNCTGVVKEYTTWSYSPVGLGFIALGVIFGLCIFFAIRPNCNCQYRGY